MIPQRKVEKAPWVSAEEIADYVYCPERWRLRLLAKRKKTSDTQRLRVVSQEELTNNFNKQQPQSTPAIRKSFRYIVVTLCLITMIGLVISLLSS